MTPQDLVAFYCACVRSSLDYACAVFHFSLPQYLQTELERIQKRALFTIYPGLSYAEALVEAGIESIQDHQRQLSISFFSAISENPDNKLNKLVPPILNSITSTITSTITITRMHNSKTINKMSYQRCSSFHCNQQHSCK